MHINIDIWYTYVLFTRVYPCTPAPQRQKKRTPSLRVRLSGTMVIAALIDAKADLHHLNKKGGTTFFWKNSDGTAEGWDDWIFLEESEVLKMMGFCPKGRS